MIAEPNYFLIAGAALSAVAAALHLGCILFGAGLVPRLPLLRTTLCAIAAVYLLRGFAFVPLMPLFRGNSRAFWLCSSTICAVIGAAYAIGIKQAWPVLSPGGA